MRPSAALLAVLLAAPAAAQGARVANALPTRAASGPALALAAEPDTTAPWRYYPLAVGNVWEYEFGDGTVAREAIFSDTVALGHRYFVLSFQQLRDDIEAPVFRTPLRYDTASATVVALGDVSNEYPYTLHCPFDTPFGDAECRGEPQRVSGRPDGVVVFGGEAPGTGTDTVQAAVKVFSTRLGFEFRYAAGVGPVYDGGEGGARALTYYKIGDEEHGMPRFVAAEPGGPEPLAASLGAWPNPTRGPLTVSVRLARPAADVEVAVYDALGRAVRRAPLGPRAAGEHGVGLSLAGLAPGVYAVVLQVDGERAAGLVALVE